MKTGLFTLLNKVLDFLTKRSKSGEKEQDITIKKIDIYNKIIMIIMLVSLFMCVLATLFPSLAITGWWFDLFEKTLKSIGG